jgi:hypothetical protein
MEIPYKGLLIKMKKLITLTLASLFLLIPNYSIAQETIWKEGDKVVVFFMCEKEETVMEVALADTKGQEEFASATFQKTISSDCVSIRPPLMFLVDDILGSYKDYRNVNTLILKVKSPVNTDFKGYIVAAGVEEKGI